MRSSNTFRQPERIFASCSSELEAFGIPPELIEDLFSTKSVERAEQEWRRVEELHVCVVDILHPDYPTLLAGDF